MIGFSLRSLLGCGNAAPYTEAEVDHKEGTTEISCPVLANDMDFVDTYSIMITTAKLARACMQ